MNEIEEIREIHRALPFAEFIQLIGPTEILTLYCQNTHCRKAFEWPRLNETDPPPSYHSRRCKKSRTVYFGHCPRPDKEQHISHTIAQETANQINARTGASLSVYRCRCGWLHIGNRIDWSAAA